AHVAAPQNLFAGYSNCSARPAAPRGQWRGQPPSARHRLERWRVRFGRHQCCMVGRLDRSAGAVNEEPFPGHPKDRDRTLVDAGMMVPTEQDPQIHVSGAVVLEPLGAVVDLAETWRGVAARILTMSVARDDRADLVSGKDAFLAPGV